MARAKKRADGRLRSSFTFDGRRIYCYGRTAAELKENEAKKRKELQEGQRYRTDPTLSQYNEKFVERRRNQVKGETLRIQKYQFKSVSSVPMEGTGVLFGDAKIREITPADIQYLQAYLLNAGNLSRRTINDTLKHLSHIFESAVLDETIQKNPCKVLTPLKETRKPARETVHRALSPEELDTFFAAAEGNYYRDLLLLMVNTGMRLGEATALTAADIDWKARLIFVRRTITKTEGDALTVGDSTKTKSGVRTIPMNTEIENIIRRQLHTNDLLRFPRQDDLIFRSSRGGIVRPELVANAIRRICDKAGIEPFTSHALRASFATVFVQRRPWDYKTLSALLGHANTGISLDLYAHAIPETKAAAMENMQIAQ